MSRKSRRARESRTQGAPGPARATTPTLVWVDRWQLECCGDAVGLGDEVAWTVLDPDPDHLRGILGAGADEVAAHEEHHMSDSRQAARANARPLAGRVSGVEVVRTHYRPAEPGSRLHVPDAATTRRTPAERVTGAEPGDGLTVAGYLVEVSPPYTALVWVDGGRVTCHGSGFAVGDEVRWSTVAPDRAALRPLLGPMAAAVTAAEEHHVEPLKIGKVSGRVVRIEAVHYAVMCDDDAERWVAVPGSQQSAVVDAAPSAPSGDGWRDHVGYLVTLG